jgi:hypothetical protein
MAITIGPGISFGPGINFSGSVPPPPAGSAFYSTSGTSYLSVTNSAEFSFGTNDFTIETWLYPIDLTVTRVFFSYAVNVSNQMYFQQQGGGLSFRVQSGGSALVTVTPAADLTASAWNHCAIVRSGSTFTMYLNGASVGTGTYAGSIPDLTAGALQIGRYRPTGSLYWAGYLSNYRIVNGTAVYTGAYTLPTDVFTATQSANPFGGSNTSAISAGQTKLLMNFNYNDLLTDSSEYSVPVTNLGGVPKVATDTLNPF